MKCEYCEKKEKLIEELLKIIEGYRKITSNDNGEWQKLKDEFDKLTSPVKKSI